MLVDLQPWMPGASYEIGQTALAHFKRRTLEVTPIELEEIENEQVRSFFHPIASPQQLEHDTTLFIENGPVEMPGLDQSKDPTAPTVRREAEVFTIQS